MAKKRALSPPPPVESSEDVESESASSGEEEEEEEQQNTANPNPNADDDNGESGEDDSGEEEEEEEESGEEDDNDNKKAPAAVPKPVDHSGSGSDSEESESDTDPPMAVKPISSKPMPAAESSEKAALFQRIWSLEDEIALLKGILDYKLKTGNIPQPSNRKPGEFPALVKKSLNMDATVGQIVEKVRRLKNKYDKAAARSSPQFTNPHDRAAFEISEKIWGDGSAVVANGKESAAGNNGYPFLREAIAAKGGEFSALVALEKLDPAKARALEEKFKKQKLAVMKHHIQKMELQKETFKLIMDGIDKS